MFVGKSYVSKKEREKAEATLLEAQSMITAEYGEDHTLAAKFNQFLIEAYNMRPESQERTELINNISSKNVDICKKYYGETNIFQIRILYTNYTARLHDSLPVSQEIIEKMKNLTYNGHKITHNQFIFKAMIVDATIAMQLGPNAQRLHVEDELGGIFEKQ